MIIVELSRCTTANRSPASGKDPSKGETLDKMELKMQISVKTFPFLALHFTANCTLFNEIASWDSGAWPALKRGVCEYFTNISSLSQIRRRSIAPTPKLEVT
jgi:hypothetical protein